MLRTFVFVALACLSLHGFANTQITKTLNDFHQAAAEADYDKYFGLLANNAIFLGTDASERWIKQEFSEYVKPYFVKGQGWLYRLTSRNISPIADSNLVFFDELLENEHYGQCRGSGVLIKENGGWKILQYNLSVMVPNNISNQVVSLISRSRNQTNSEK